MWPLSRHRWDCHCGESKRGPPSLSRTTIRALVPSKHPKTLSGSPPHSLQGKGPLPHFIAETVGSERLSMP